MNEIMHMAQHGLGVANVGSAAIHASMGVFFAISGWHKLTNKDRHAGIVATFKADHIPAVGFMQWWVPGWEFAGGMGLLLGILPAFCAAVLAVICFVASCAEAPARVAAYKPIDGLDKVDDYLYLPEVVYLVVLLAIVAGV